jgi:hypothetical protein
MADNLSWTPGAGAEIATDQADDDTHVQIVKLAQSGDGSKDPLQADSDGMRVDGASRGETVSGGIALCDNTYPVQATYGGGYIPPSSTRRSIIINNTSAVDIWVGSSSVQEGQGLLLQSGQIAVLDKSPCAAIYIWADSSNRVTVNYFEELD